MARNENEKQPQSTTPPATPPATPSTGEPMVSVPQAFLERLERGLKDMELRLGERDAAIAELQESNQRLLDVLSQQPPAPALEEPRDYKFLVPTEVKDEKGKPTGEVVLKEVILPTCRFRTTKPRYINGTFYEASVGNPLVISLAEGTKLDRDLEPVLPGERAAEPVPHFARVAKTHPHMTPADPAFGGTPTGPTAVTAVEGGESALARAADKLHSTTEVKV